MKRSKNIYIMLAVLVVAFLATIGVINYEEKQEQIKNSDETILEIASEDITALSWEYDGEIFAFHKDETWLYDEDEKFPVDGSAINELLSIFEDFGAAFIIEEVDDLSQYGLDEPECTINITATEELSYEIQLGTFSTMDSQRYVSIGDGNVYLVSTDPLDTYNVELSNFIKHDDVPYFDTISEITFSGNENYAIFYEEESIHTYCTDDLYFTKIGGKTLPLDTYATESYIDEFSYLDLTNYVNYKVTDEELAYYGLDVPELTVTVDYSYEDENEETIQDTFTISIGRNPEDVAELEEQKAAKVKDTDEENSYSNTSYSEDETEEEGIPAYVRMGNSSIIYEITSDEYDAIIAGSYDDLRHEEVLCADFEDITQVDITLEGESYTFIATIEDEDEDAVWTYNEKTLDIDDFEYALRNLTAENFTSDSPSGKKELSLTVHLNNENYPTVSIELYRHDGNHCVAVVDGEPVSLVSRSNTVELIEAIRTIVLE